MIKHLIRSLLYSFKFKGKEYNSTKTVERPVTKFVRILSISSRNLRNSRIFTKLISSSYKRILIKSKMPKVKSGFYAVRIGRKPGVYQTWYVWSINILFY